MTSTDPSQLSPGGTPMPAEPSPAREPAARPAAAAQALRDAASAVAAAWEQPMEPDAYSRAVSQLYSVLRDLGIAIRGLARYQIIPVPPGPADRGFAQHVTTSAAWLLGAWHSLDGVLAAEGLGPLPGPAGPGDVLCQAARDAITAWRQPSGTAADRDTHRRAAHHRDRLPLRGNAQPGGLRAQAPHHRPVRGQRRPGRGTRRPGQRHPDPGRPGHPAPRPGRHRQSRRPGMSDGQITNGQRAALDGINAHAQSSTHQSNSQPLTHHRSRGPLFPAAERRRPEFLLDKAGSYGRSRRP